jgi:ferritin-like metal-binding protein YciE
MMKFDNLYDLFVGELKDLYDAEHQITEALPKMHEAATSTELQNAFQQHLKQTKTHIKRLENVFEIIAEDAERETCDAMEGLLEEGDEIIEENESSSTLDAALIAAAQRVEHYEIAGYGTVRTYAQVLGFNDAVDILQQTLDEEGETNKLLTSLAMKVNPQAV